MHSRYHRRPAYLPTIGQEVRLTLTIRRFYCHDPVCARRTFAERLPRLLDRYAQRTRRLADAQVRTALALGATPTARLLPHLAMPTSATTLLRGIRKWPLPPGSKPIIVGVDDWVLRKGRTYGTILVDLERRRPIDLLPDRSASTLAARLRRDPHIQVVARDRSTEYARGTAMGAPDAVQVADRWHLLLNTRQMVERWLARVHPRLKLLPAVAPSSPLIQRVAPYPRARSEMLVRAAARGRWEAAYDDVRRRHAEGHSLRRINRETGLARATVRKYAFAESFPRNGMREPKPSMLDPYLGHLHGRLEEGCENAAQLWRELQGIGFAGTSKQVRRWLSEWRAGPAGTTIRSSPAPADIRVATSTASPLASSKKLSWYLLREPEDLGPEAAAVVSRVLQDTEAAKVVDFGRRFCRIVRSRCGQQPSGKSDVTAFDEWLGDAQTCGVRIVESFAAGLGQDRDAVRSALTLPWSSGQAEWQITRLKLLKRAMYGLANLDLLRRRFLLAA
ncbi:ISL3 family transposase ISMex10 [Methylobacterium bullatum]|uniref:ISL3 family transposase ISMex10 n=1 Tax=Methylobacterium bullatum TaxID=570505 RepID=A0AAV4ZB84_9HYPH|nr:ISL3 family transposase ISMex10 [Methylobacterium bullatum]